MFIRKAMTSQYAVWLRLLVAIELLSLICALRNPDVEPDSDDEIPEPLFIAFENRTPHECRISIPRFHIVNNPLASNRTSPLYPLDDEPTHYAPTPVIITRIDRHDRTWEARIPDALRLGDGGRTIDTIVREAAGGYPEWTIHIVNYFVYAVYDQGPHIPNRTPRSQVTRQIRWIRYWTSVRNRRFRRSRSSNV